MKYKTLFRLLLKGLGVFFLMQGFLQLIAHIVSVLQTILWPPAIGGVVLSTYHFLGWLPISAVMQLGIGLYLFFGGKWIVNKAIPSNRPYCPECAYDLTGLVGDRCPECGTMLPRNAGT